MKRFLILLAALACATALVTGCGGSDSSESGSETTAASGSESGGSSSGSSNTGNAEVDKYCNQVEELAASIEEAVKNKDASSSEELSKQAQQLAQDATGLVSTLIEDPSLSTAVQECSQKATDSLQELAGSAFGGAGMPDGMDGMDDMMPDDKN
jgi:basic membrane lipoprotein Med (substrate-binding protein (PBP1-ABC) superfamily)